MPLRLATGWEMEKVLIMKVRRHCSLLQKILQSGIEEKVAIKSVNSVLITSDNG